MKDANNLNTDSDGNSLWKGTHTFLRPIVFASNQVFSSTSLKVVGQTAGALLVFKGNAWSSLPSGKSGQILTFYGGFPTWSNINLKDTQGVLSFDKGGTGFAGFNQGDLLVGDSGALIRLPVGAKGHVLVSSGKAISWAEAPGVKGEGRAANIPVWSDSSTLTISPISVTSRTSVKIGTDTGSILFGDGGTISFAANRLRIVSDVAEVVLGGGEFVFSTDRPVFKLDNAGVMRLGIVPAERITGMLDAKRGGTGIAKYRPGDLLFALDTNKLSALSTEHSDGYFLQVVRGKPTWTPLPFIKGGVSALSGPTLSLPAGDSMRPPLEFTREGLTMVPKSGALEWTGESLFFTGASGVRHQVASTQADILGTASNVTGIVSMEHGGTGSKLNLAVTGSLMVVQSPTSIGELTSDSSTQGKFLASRGFGLVPIWETAITEVLAEKGLLVSSYDNSRPTLRLDTSYSASWLTKQVFAAGLELGFGVTLVLPDSGGSYGAPLRFLRTQAPYKVCTGDMWFDGQLRFCVDGAVVNLTEGSSANKTTQFLQVMVGESPVPKTKRVVKIPLPYGADGYNRAFWRIVRVDFRAEIAPVDESAEIDILINGISILQSRMMLPSGMNAFHSTSFVTEYAYSGDLVEIAYGNTGNCDICSVYMLIEKTR